MHYVYLFLLVSERCWVRFVVESVCRVVVFCVNGHICV